MTSTLLLSLFSWGAKSPLDFPEMFVGTGARGDERRGCYGFKEPFVYSGLLTSLLCFTMCNWEDLATSCLILEPCFRAGPNLQKPPEFTPAVGGIFCLPAPTHQLSCWGTALPKLFPIPPGRSSMLRFPKLADLGE